MIKYMKIKVNKPTVVDVKYLKVNIEDVDYGSWELNFCGLCSIEQHPFHTNKYNIEFSVELETGKVLGWENGNTLTTFDKVRDGGRYALCDADFNEIVSYEGYVPKMLDRLGDGYGDYLQFTIDKNGFIENWDVSFREFDCEWVS